MACTTPIVIDLAMLAYSSIVAVAFIIIRYLIAALQQDENGKYEAKYMAGDFLLGFSLVILFSVILQHLSSANGQNNLAVAILDGVLGPAGAGKSNQEYAIGNSNIMCNALSYLSSVSSYAMDTYKMNMWISMNAGEFAKYSVSYSISKFYATVSHVQFSFAPVGEAGNAWENEFSSKASLMLNVAVFANLSQYYITSLFLTPSIIILLSTAIVFRTLPFFKGFANLLLALIITFTIILPFTLYGESYIFQTPHFVYFGENVHAVDPNNLAISNAPVTSYGSNFRSFSLVLGGPWEEASGVAASSITDIGGSSFGEDSVRAVMAQRFKFDGNKFMVKDKLFADYAVLTSINSATAITAAFLAGINLVVVGISIKTLQLMLGDADSLIEMFLKWT